MRLKAQRENTRAIHARATAGAGRRASVRASRWYAPSPALSRTRIPAGISTGTGTACSRLIS